MFGKNRIAGLFTEHLFIGNACHNLLKPQCLHILSFIATFVQAENGTDFFSELFISIFQGYQLQ